jgi:hypothetical protein
MNMGDFFTNCDMYVCMGPNKLDLFLPMNKLNCSTTYHSLLVAHLMVRSSWRKVRVCLLGVHGMRIIWLSMLIHGHDLLIAFFKNLYDFPRAGIKSISSIYYLLILDSYSTLIYWACFHR